MNVSNLLLRITGDPSDAKRALREVEAELRAFASKEAQAHIKVSGFAEAKVELDRLQTALTLIGQRDVTAKVKVKIDRNRSELANLGRELEHALAGGAGARPLEAIFRDIGRVSSEVGKLGVEATTVFGKFVEGAVGAGQATGVLLSKLGSSIGGAVLQGIQSIVTTLATWLVIAVALLPIIEALAGAALALGASLLSAAAGAAAFIVTLGATGLPVLAVVIGLFTRLLGATQALSKSRQSQAQNAAALTSAEQQHTAAMEQQTQAAQTLKTSTVDAYRAWADAIQAVKEDLVSVEHAQLGIEESSLRLKEAQQSLKEFRAQIGAGGNGLDDLFKKFSDVRFHGDPAAELASHGIKLTTDEALQLQEKILAVKEAKLGEKDAANALHDSNVKLNRDRKTEADFVAKGIRAYQPYVAALRGVRDAGRQVAASTRAITAARTAANAGLAKYSASELGVASKLLGLWSQIKGLLKTVEVPVFKALSDFITAIGNVLKDPAIVSGVQGIGDGLGAVVRMWTRFITDPQTVGIFAKLLAGARPLLKLMAGRAAIDFFKILLHIAKDALPPLLDLMRRIVNKLDEWAHESGMRSFKDTIHRIVTSFRDWLEVGHQVARVIGAFVGDVSDKGDNIAVKFGRILKHFADWLNTKEGQRAIRHWIDHMVTRAGDFLQAVKDLAKALQVVADFLVKIAGYWDKLQGVFHKGGSIFSTLNKLNPLSKLGPFAGPFANPLSIPFGIYHKILGGKEFGGLVPGIGGGDRGMMPVEGGEYVIRRSVVEQLGLPFLSQLAGDPVGATRMPATAGPRGPIGIHLVTPAGAVPDGRFVSQQIADVLGQMGLGS